MRVYLDLVMVLNFLVDGLLLLAADRMAGFPTAPGRTLAAAALGAVYSGACLVPRLAFLGSLLWRLVFLGLMGIIGFGWSRSTLKRCGIFALLSLALGGLAVSIGVANIPALTLGALGLWGLCRTAFSQLGAAEYVDLEIRWQGRRERLVALRDTGNSLRDPLTGEPVLVLSGDAACRLTGLTEDQLRRPLETLAQRPLPGLRLMPYRAVGVPEGLLLAMRFPDVRIGGRERSALVAFAPGGLGKEEMVQALTGGVF